MAFRGCWGSNEKHIEKVQINDGEDFKGQPAKRLLRIALVGEANSGKTSLMCVLTGTDFKTAKQVQGEGKIKIPKTMWTTLGMLLENEEMDSDDRVLQFVEIGSQFHFSELLTIVSTSVDLVVYCVKPYDFAQTHGSGKIIANSVRILAAMKGCYESKRLIVAMTKMDTISDLADEEQKHVKRAWDDVYKELLPQGPRRVSCSAKTGQFISEFKEELRNFFKLAKPMPIISKKLSMVVLGPPSVGKTTFLHCLNTGQSPKETFGPTIAAELVITKIYNCYTKKHIVLKSWDTAGQERYLSVLPNSVIRDADIVLLMFDAKTPDLKILAERWSKQVQEVCNKNPHVEVVGMKSDLLSPSDPARNSRTFFSYNDPDKIQKFVKDLAIMRSSSYCRGFLEDATSGWMNIKE